MWKFVKLFWNSRLEPTKTYPTGLSIIDTPKGSQFDQNCEMLPYPFARAVKEFQVTPDGVTWYCHDGGECPVMHGTHVAIPAGTYHTKNSDDCIHVKDSAFTWEHKRAFHLRDEIQWFKITQLPNGTVV